METTGTDPSVGMISTWPRYTEFDVTSSGKLRTFRLFSIRRQYTSFCTSLISLIKLAIELSSLPNSVLLLIFVWCALLTKFDRHERNSAPLKYYWISHFCYHHASKATSFGVAQKACILSDVFLTVRLIISSPSIPFQRHSSVVCSILTLSIPNRSRYRILWPWTKCSKQSCPIYCTVNIK